MKHERTNRTSSVIVTEEVDYAADGSATTNRYLYKDWLVLAVTDGEGNVLETYTHGADLSGEPGGSAGGIGGILASTQAGGAVCYHYDFNGNIVGVTDASGAVVSSLTYTPFGYLLARTGSFTPRYQFSTKEYSPRTGLNYYGYRYYLPNLGRWLTRDPIDETDYVTLYSFVKQSPINIFDYLGLRGNHGGNQGNHKRKPCCKGVQYDSRKKCCEDGKVVDKVTIWVCKRRLGSPDGKIPAILFVSHSYVVPPDIH